MPSLRVGVSRLRFALGCNSRARRERYPTLQTPPFALPPHKLRTRRFYQTRRLPEPAAARPWYLRRFHEHKRESLALRGISYAVVGFSPPGAEKFESNGARRCRRRHQGPNFTGCGTFDIGLIRMKDGRLSRRLEIRPALTSARKTRAGFALI